VPAAAAFIVRRTDKLASCRTGGLLRNANSAATTRSAAAARRNELFQREGAHSGLATAQVCAQATGSPGSFAFGHAGRRKTPHTPPGCEPLERGCVGVVCACHKRQKRLCGPPDSSVVSCVRSFTMDWEAEVQKASTLNQVRAKEERSACEVQRPTPTHCH
jgi:hypothetical protein